MLKFARNKLITIHRKDPNTLLVHGVLEDDIYGLEVDAEVRLPEARFVKVVGRWTRYTTPECPRALAYIHEAEGLQIDAQIEHALQKTVGRNGCRHYVTLLIECCKSVQETMMVLDWEAARQHQPGLSLSDFIANASPLPAKTPPRIDTAPAPPGPKVSSAPGDAADKPVAQPLIAPGNRPFPGSFVIDLHTHSFPASPCGTASVDELIQEAQRIGLDGICLTDHNFSWPAEKVEALRQKHGFLVLRGNEITTDQGHMVVFGLERDLGGTGLIKLEKLSAAVRDANGFLIVAHPFRGFLTFGVEQLGLTVEKASARSLFQWVDGVEGLNGMVTDAENTFASRVCRRLGLPSTGGSDAHSVSKIGCYATEFTEPIHNEVELVAALRLGNYRPVVFRQEVSVAP
jgi:predicted metal-dependent phosphoesterase TrpH